MIAQRFTSTNADSMNESTEIATAGAEPAASSIRAAILIVSTLIASWLGMQAVHEFGHVLGALLTGGRVEQVALHPLTISRTDVSPNPRPLIVVWAGPIAGVLIPLLAWSIVAIAKWPATFLIRFFAGFCLVANGLYIGIGSFWNIGDCGVMHQHGAAPWQLWVFGALTVPIGFLLWNGLGKNFGLGPDARPVSLGVAWGTFSAATLLIVMGLVVGGE